MLQTSSYHENRGGNVANVEPKSAHATSVTENYVEKRKEKAEKQMQRERKTTKLSEDVWRRSRYAIL